MTTGILNRDFVLNGSAAAMVNNAVEGFVKAAALDLPRGIRINAISPALLEESVKKYSELCPGFEPVSSTKVARAYRKVFMVFNLVKYIMSNRDRFMSGHVFIVSEWLPKEGYDQELWQRFQQIMELSHKEDGCIRAHATRQISHPGSPSKSKYTIVLLQEYIDVNAFNIHCAADYVTSFFKECIENKNTTIVDDWRCRLFSEDK